MIDNSRHKNWSEAVHEWEVTFLEEDPAGRGICICGQLGLVKLFTIQNIAGGNVLHPIGSSCINHFDRSDLNQEASLLGALAKLRSSIHGGDAIALNKEYFSRAMLKHFLDAGAFTPDGWNRGDGYNDYEFLAKMFNKRDKDGITSRQTSMIWALLKGKVFPFVLSDDRIS